jgi:ATP synthase protein I
VGQGGNGRDQDPQQSGEPPGHNRQAYGSHVREDEALKARLDRLSDALAAQQADEAKASASSQGPEAESLQHGALGNVLSLAFRVMSEFVAAVMVGTALGWGVDRLFGTSPIFLILFLLLGAAAGFWNVYRIGMQKPGNNRE